MLNIHIYNSITWYLIGILWVPERNQIARFKWAQWYCGFILACIYSCSMNWRNGTILDKWHCINMVKKKPSFWGTDKHITVWFQHASIHPWEQQQIERHNLTKNVVFHAWSSFKYLLILHEACMLCVKELYCCQTAILSHAKKRTWKESLINTDKI